MESSNSWFKGVMQLVFDGLCQIFLSRSYTSEPSDQNKHCEQKMVRENSETLT